MNELLNWSPSATMIYILNVCGIDEINKKFKELPNTCYKYLIVRKMLKVTENPSLDD